MITREVWGQMASCDVCGETPGRIYKRGESLLCDLCLTETDHNAQCEPCGAVDGTVRWTGSHWSCLSCIVGE